MCLFVNARKHVVQLCGILDGSVVVPRDGFAVARETARRWPHISIVVASGQAYPGPGDMPEGARFFGKPFTADMVHDHLQEILPDGRKPAPLRDMA